MGRVLVKCQACDHIITTNTITTKSCREVFKIQSGPLNCNSEKVLYFLRCKFVMTLHMLERLKQSSVFDLIIIKVNANLFEKESRMYHRGVFIHTVYKTATADWEVTLFEKCETHKQLKKRETFWHHKLKTFYPLGLNEKEEYLF